MAVARARVVPRPWHLAPAVGLALLVIPKVMQEALAYAPEVSGAFVWVEPWGFLAGVFVPLGLGVIAIVVGFARIRTPDAAIPAA